MNSDSGPKPERRAAPRFLTNCRCWVEQDSVTLFGTVTNISEEGVFLRTVPLINTGSGIDLKLSLGNGVVTATGEVCWTKTAESKVGAPSCAPGMGIRFKELQSGQDLLKRFVLRSSLVPDPYHED